MKRMILLAMMIGGSGLAQEGTAQHAKLVEVRHKKAVDICGLLASSVLAKMRCTHEMPSIIALAGRPEDVAIAEAMIRQLDRPDAAKQNLEITAYMILGTPDKSTDLPKALGGVVAQLQQIFPFNGYRLIETMLIRGVEGDGGEASGMMPVPGEPDLKPMYQFRYQRCTIEGEGAERRIHLREIKFGGRVPVRTEKGFQYIDTGVNTTIDVREGQKAVIGKASLGPGKESLFLVLSARVVE